MLERRGFVLHLCLHDRTHVHHGHSSRQLVGRIGGERVARLFVVAEREHEVGHPDTRLRPFGSGGTRRVVEQLGGDTRRRLNAIEQFERTTKLRRS